MAQDTHGAQGEQLTGSDVGLLGAENAHGEAGSGERLAPDQGLGEAQQGAQHADLVLVVVLSPWKINASVFPNANANANAP